MAASVGAVTRMREDVELKDVTAEQLASGRRPRARSATRKIWWRATLNSLAEARSDPDARPRAVYAGERIVGFLMYDVQASQRTNRAKR